MPMKAKKQSQKPRHIHMYRRKNLGVSKEYIVYACHTCTHYLTPAMVIGKQCLCNRCGREVFQMRPIHTEMSKPHCVRCTKGYKGGPSVGKIASNLDKLLGMTEE